MLTVAPVSAWKITSVPFTSTQCLSCLGLSVLIEWNHSSSVIIHRVNFLDCFGHFRAMWFLSAKKQHAGRFTFWEYVWTTKVTLFLWLFWLPCLFFDLVFTFPTEATALTNCDLIFLECAESFVAVLCMSMHLSSVVPLFLSEEIIVLASLIPNRILSLRINYVQLLQ